MDKLSNSSIMKLQEYKTLTNNLIDKVENNLTNIETMLTYEMMNSNFFHKDKMIVNYKLFGKLTIKKYNKLYLKDLEILRLSLVESLLKDRAKSNNDNVISSIDQLIELIDIPIEEKITEKINKMTNNFIDNITGIMIETNPDALLNIADEKMFKESEEIRREAKEEKSLNLSLLTKEEELQKEKDLEKLFTEPENIEEEAEEEKDSEVDNVLDEVETIEEEKDVDIDKLLSEAENIIKEAEEGEGNFEEGEEEPEEEPLDEELQEIDIDKLFSETEDIIAESTEGLENEGKKELSQSDEKYLENLLTEYEGDLEKEEETEEETYEQLLSAINDIPEDSNEENNNDYKSLLDEVNNYLKEGEEEN